MKNMKEAIVNDSKPPLKGWRTYATLAVMVIVGISDYITGHPVLTPELRALLQTVLGAAAAYFRSQA